MSQLLPQTVQTFLSVASPDPGPILEEMTTYGDEQGFPIVGPDVGQFLAVATRLVGAERIFEFGSGFGYSAAWFARSLPSTGEIILTDFDESNLATARTYLTELGYEGTARFERGDAIDTFDSVDGDFDVVLVDLHKDQYVDAFTRASDRISDGGLIVADNMMGGPVDPASVTAALRGEEPVDPATGGVARYIELVRNAREFETAFLPLGQGIAVSHKEQR